MSPKKYHPPYIGVMLFLGASVGTSTCMAAPVAAPPHVTAFSRAFISACVHTLPTFAGAPPVLKALGFELTPMGDHSLYELSGSRWSGYLNLGLSQGSDPPVCILEAPDITRQVLLNRMRVQLAQHIGQPPGPWIKRPGGDPAMREWRTTVNGQQVRFFVTTGMDDDSNRGSNIGVEVVRPETF